MRTPWGASASPRQIVRDVGKEESRGLVEGQFTGFFAGDPCHGGIAAAGIQAKKSKLPVPPTSPRRSNRNTRYLRYN
jgi:hypothetical protein